MKAAKPAHGPVANPSRGQLNRRRACSGSENFELLGERWYWSEGVPRLSFAHHVDHFDAGKDRRGAGHRQPLVAVSAWEWKR